MTSLRRTRRPPRAGLETGRQPLAPGPAQLPHALHRAGPDPVDRCQQRLPRLHHELRAAGQLPRHRRRLSPRQLRPRRLALGAPRPGGPGRLRARVPGQGLRPGRPPPAPGSQRRRRSSPVAQPVDHLRAGDRRDGGPGPGRRPHVRPLPTPGGLPPRHRGQHRRDRGLLPAVVPASSSRGVGAGRRHRDDRPAARQPPLVAGSGGAGRDRPVGGRVHVGARPLVALLQDHLLPAPGHPRGARGVGEQHPAPGRVPRRHPAQDPALLLLSVPPPAAGRPRRRPGDRSRHRERRGHRPLPGGQARRRDRDRPRAGPARPRPQRRPPLPGSPRERAHQRRSGVPAADAQALRPDPLRAARLAHRARWRVEPPAGELSAHGAGGPLGAVPPDSERHVRHVQLLPAVPARSVCQHPRGGVPRPALRGGRRAARRAPAGRAHRRGARADAELHHARGTVVS